MRALTGAILPSLLAIVSLAQRSDQTPDFYEKFYAKNFAGWKGIVFTCEFDPSDSVLNRICDRATTDLDLLAASHRLKVEITKPNDAQQAAFIAAADSYINLTLYLVSTKTSDDHAFRAVHARLVYETFLSNAIEKNAKPGSVGSIARSGELKIWARGAIGSGSGSELIAPIGDGVESLLKEALTLQVRYASAASSLVSPRP